MPWRFMWVEIQDLLQNILELELVLVSIDLTTSVLSARRSRPLLEGVCIATALLLDVLYHLS